MRSFLLAVAAMQILQCSGVPSPETALKMSLMKLNEMTNTPNLCSITRRRLRAMYPTGKLTYNVDLVFSVKETTCSKNSRLEVDSPLCRFRPARTAEKGVCRSRVKYFADEITDIHVHCWGLKSFKGKIHSSESMESHRELKTKIRKAMIRKIQFREAKSKKVESRETSSGETKSNESRDIESREIESREAESTEVESNETSLEISNECSHAKCYR